MPVMHDRAQQALVKMALEPQWEAKFEPNSYGFRPGRSGHDAIGAIFFDICKQVKYVLDADIAGCFDHISHEALVQKLQSYPAMQRLIRAWLEAGVMGAEGFEETRSGTPQGGVIMPPTMLPKRF
jgi:RNA-directed DNA polymerase